jgi:hypothetical protein
MDTNYTIKATGANAAFIQVSPTIANPQDTRNHCNLTEDQELLYQQVVRMVKRGEKENNNAV